MFNYKIEFAFNSLMLTSRTQGSINATINKLDWLVKMRSKHNEESCSRWVNSDVSCCSPCIDVN